MPEPHRLSLAQCPTPLMRLDQLGAALDGANLWMKRDDLTGLEFSGNKIRKLEYILAAALRENVDAIVTEGTPQSNHCRATAAACARLGLRCVLLLRPEPPAGAPQGNHLLDTLFGAECRFHGRPAFDRQRETIVNEVLHELRAAGRKPRWVPMGASEPLGCWGYIRAAQELAEQLRAARIESCDVVCAVSSGGTLAGLIIGCALHGLDHVHVHAVPVSDSAGYFREHAGALAKRTVEQFDLPVTIEPGQWRFLDGYVGRGYAVPYAEAIETAWLLARSEAVVLDPVYTAKAFCAALDEVRAGRLGRERPLVFLHTGGAPSIFAWPELLGGAPLPGRVDEAHA